MVLCSFCKNVVLQRHKISDTDFLKFKRCRCLRNSNPEFKNYDIKTHLVYRRNKKLPKFNFKTKSGGEK